MPLQKSRTFCATHRTTYLRTGLSFGRRGSFRRTRRVLKDGSWKPPAPAESVGNGKKRRRDHLHSIRYLCILIARILASNSFAPWLARLAVG